MKSRKKLIQSYETTQWLVKRFAEGLSTEDSLAVPQFKSNNFNWVAGHILVSRDRVLEMLGHEGVLSHEEEMLYDSGSEPITPEKAVVLDRLLTHFDASLEKIEDALLTATDDELSVIIDEKRGQTVRERIEGLHWHETYHVGQLEILRQVSTERETFP